MYANIGGAIEGMLLLIKWILLPLSVLGLWKLGEIIWWCIQHIKIIA